jgi:hypothetical protein
LYLPGDERFNRPTVEALSQFFDCGAYAEASTIAFIFTTYGYCNKNIIRWDGTLFVKRMLPVEGSTTLCGVCIDENEEVDMFSG